MRECVDLDLESFVWWVSVCVVAPSMRLAGFAAPAGHHLFRLVQGERGIFAPSSSPWLHRFIVPLSTWFHRRVYSVSVAGLACMGFCLVALREGPSYLGCTLCLIRL